jgi:hypothetical protein
MSRTLLFCITLIFTPLVQSKSLGDMQREFSLCVGKLIMYAYSLGYEITLGDAYRSPAVKYGHPNSMHRYRLAIDINLFKEGKYLSKTEDHKELGMFWVKCNPLARWGGSFGDGNHYSFTYKGVK